MNTCRAWAWGGALVGLLASRVAAVNIETVPVGDPGNTADTRFGAPACGAVSYTYNIGKYEVTVGQYTAFLNAVAKRDTNGLYNVQMSGAYGCGILRIGDPGFYTYLVATGWENRPVNYVSWGDGARFANWLNNGQPPGSQNPFTTEDGAYYLNGAKTDEVLMAATRKSACRWALPSEDEWYKAAYYNPATNSYYDYPTSSNDINTSMANYGWRLGRSTNVGTYPYPSPYGTFDQGGNLWEWNEAVMSWSTRNRRGGDWGGEAVLMNASYRFVANHPTDEGGYSGFRVVEVAEPATFSLMVFAAAGLFARRRACR